MAELKIPKTLLSPELWDDNKTKVKALIKKNIKKKLAAGITDYKELRKGLEPFKVGDRTFEIRKVNKFIESIKNEGSKPVDVELIDQEYRVRKNQREQLLKQQTDKTGAADATEYGAGKRKLLAGQQDHHIRFRSLLEPFYEGLNEKQALELTQWFLEHEFPIGNVIQNLEGIDQDLHQVFEDSIHTWAKDNQIDVGKFKDTTGTNFKINKKGQLLVAGGAGGEVIDTGKKIPGIQGPQIPKNIPIRKAGKAKFPYLGDMPLNERFAAATLWINTVEEPLLNKTAEIMERQDLRRFGKGSPEAKTKAQWLEKWKVDAQDVGAKARILGDFPHLRGIFTKGLLASGVTTVLNTGKGIASVAFDPRDLANPRITTNIAQAEKAIEAGEDPWTVIKREGLESAGVIKDELLKAGGVLTGFKLATKIPKAGALVQGGGSLLTAPLVMKGLLAAAVYEGTNAYVKEKTGRSLNERLIMDTGYADFFHTERVVKNEVDDEGNLQEVVTYEKKPEIQEKNRQSIRTYIEGRKRDNQKRKEDNEKKRQENLEKNLLIESTL